MSDPLGEERITTWRALSDYAIGGAAGLAGFLLGFSKTKTILIAGSVFLAWVLGKYFYQRWRETTRGQR
jgi:hypothetical protein